MREALQNGPSVLSLLEKEGVTQRFEYSFELGWKTMKDFLEAGGVIVSPITAREVIKEAHAAKIVSDGQVWIDMLEHRNLLSHSYDSPVFEEAVDAVASRYLTAMNDLAGFFSSQDGG